MKHNQSCNIQPPFEIGPQLNDNIHARKEPDKRYLSIQLPIMEYKDAWDLQKIIVAAIKNKVIQDNVILFLEHQPVFTLGRRGGSENLMVSRDFLGKKGVPVIQVERGGNITFHGPGQLIVYPIIDLRVARLSVEDYVEKLEEIMIRTAGDWGITANRNPMNRGVWVGNNKLGSIGIAIRRGICFHGIAFNVNVSLEPFGWINPCGLHDIGMTSMEQELSREICMDHVRTGLKHHMEEVLGIKLFPVSLTELYGLLKNHSLEKNVRE